MTVFFDVSSLLPKNLTSEGIYTKNLFRLLRGLGADVQPIYKPPGGLKENFIEYHTGQTGRKRIGWFAPKDAIYHGPSGSILTDSPKFKKVISINDLSMFREGTFEPGLGKQLQTHVKNQMFKNPDAVILPTMEVHNEFLVRFPKFVSKVHVINPGCDHIMDNAKVSDKRISENPYFLFVGTIDKRSNVAAVVKAFNGFCEMKKDVNLVIAGDLGHGGEAVRKLVDSSPHRARINLVGYKTGAHLKKIYTDAIATIAPSLYEGFNFSIVESMKLGTPVLTSGVGSMEEIGRGASHLVNPKDPEQIMAGMERLYIDRIYREKVIQGGNEVVEGMNWLKCAKAVVEVYNKL